jgi:hypothetical protein
MVDRTMSLHPDIIDAMVAAGCTASMLAAILRVQWNIDCRATVAESRDARNARNARDASERKRAADRARMQQKRAVARTSRQSRDTCDTGPSLIILNSKEQERDPEAQVAATSATAAPLPATWTPDARSRNAVAESLGSETAAAALLDNFRDYYGARPNDQRSPSAWNQTYRSWGRKERKLHTGPQQLPLLRIFGGPARPSIPGKIYLRFGSPGWEAWARHKGPVGFPRDRDGGWWFPSEWPPGMEPALRESG